jgi:CRP-like cAMP-binding protein
LDRAVPRHLRRGQTLYFAGERERRVHLLVNGVLKLSATNGSGSETILGLATPGDIVGDVAAIDQMPQPLDAIAATPCEVTGLDADLFIEVVSRNADAAVELATALATRMRWMCDTAMERSSSEITGRLAGRLLDLADMLGRVNDGAVEMEMPLAQGDLGQLAGMCRESACKTLRKFKADGVLDYRGRKLRILRPDVLERIRCAGRA